MTESEATPKQTESERLSAVYDKFNDKLIRTIGDVTRDALDNYLYMSNQPEDWTYRELRVFVALVGQAVMTRMVEQGFSTVTAKGVATKEELDKRKEKAEAEKLKPVPTRQTDIGSYL